MQLRMDYYALTGDLLGSHNGNEIVKTAVSRFSESEKKSASVLTFDSTRFASDDHSFTVWHLMRCAETAQAVGMEQLEILCFPSLLPDVMAVYDLVTRFIPSVELERLEA